MKLRGHGSGRRGRKRRNSEERLIRKEQESLRASQKEQERREIALARILPRLQRWCAFSTLGVVKHTFSKDHIFYEGSNNRTRYFSIEGWGISPRNIWSKWSTEHSSLIEMFAKIKQFEVVEPKNAMLLLAEMSDGKHD